MQAAESAHSYTENLQGAADFVPGGDRVHSAPVGAAKLHVGRLTFKSASRFSVQSPTGGPVNFFPVRGGTRLSIQRAARLASAQRGPRLRLRGVQRPGFRSPAFLLRRTNEQRGAQKPGHCRQKGVCCLQKEVAGLLQHLSKNAVFYDFKELLQRMAQEQQYLYLSA